MDLDDIAAYTTAMAITFAASIPFATVCGSSRMAP